MITLGIYDPLTTYVDGKIEPFLAESIEGNDDARRVHDRPSARACMFHDDTPLNADAVVKHFDRLQDPATACPCKTTRRATSSRWTRPTAPRASRSCSTSPRPNVAFPDYLAGSSGYIESPTAAADGVNFKTDGVGTGPFMLDEYVAGERTVLVQGPELLAAPTRTASSCPTSTS